MQAKAILRHLRLSPRKVRRIASSIRGLHAAHAESLLEHTPHRAARPLIKLLRSAVANAEVLGVGEKATLLIKQIEVSQGRTLSRARPRSRGMSHPIARRSSHIILVVEGPGGMKKQGSKKALTEGRKTETRKQAFSGSDQKTAKRAGGVTQRIFQRKTMGG